MKLKEFEKKLMNNPKFKREFEKVDLAFEIGEMLIEARILKGITQSELAKLLKTKQPSIARAENGEHLPSLSFLQKVAKAIGTYLLPPKFAFMEKAESIDTSSWDSPIVSEADNKDQQNFSKCDSGYKLDFVSYA